MSVKGFVSTLESVIASALFLVVIISVLPAFVSSADPGETVLAVIDHRLEAMEAMGDLEPYVRNRNTSGLADVVAKDVSGWNVRTSMLTVNETRGVAGAGESYIDLSINDSIMERVRLLLWIGRDTTVTVDVDDTQIRSVDSEGFYDIGLSSAVTDGDNNVTLDVSGSQSRYRFETYNRYRDDDFPTTDVISHTRLVEDMNMSYAPAEVIVYAWQ